MALSLPSPFSWGAPHPHPVLPPSPLLSQGPPPPGSFLRLPGQPRGARACDPTWHPISTPVLVGSGCCNETPPTGGLTQQAAREAASSNSRRIPFLVSTLYPASFSCVFLWPCFGAEKSLSVRLLKMPPILLDEVPTLLTSSPFNLNCIFSFFKVCLF